MSYDEHEDGLVMSILSHENKAEAAYLYCKENGIKGWDKAEEMMLMDYEFAKLYMREVLQGPWPRFWEHLHESKRAANSAEKKLYFMMVTMIYNGIVATANDKAFRELRAKLSTTD